MSTRWIYKLQKQREESGDIAPRRVAARPAPKRKLAGHADRLLELVEAQPDASLNELRERLDVVVGVTTVWRALKALGVTFKKGGARD